MLTHIFEFLDEKRWRKVMFLVGSHVLWKKYNFSFIYRLCHDFKSSLFFDLLCHFCLNFVVVVMSWASQSVKIGRLHLELGWWGRLGSTENLAPRHSSRVSTCSARCALWRSSLELSLPKELGTLNSQPVSVCQSWQVIWALLLARISR